MTAGMIQIDLFPLSIALLSLVALVFVALAVSAVVHSRTGATLWQACLWAATGLLVIVVLLTLTTLALVLAPALALAGIASVAARQRTAHARPGEVARSMETVGGVAAGALGLVASAYLLAAPDQWVSQSSICDAQGNCHAVTTGSPSLLLADPMTALLLAALALAFFGSLAFTAVRHSQTGAPVWRGWLWGADLVLLLFSFLGALSIGMFFLPSAVLALYAALGSLGQTCSGIAAMA